MSVIASYVFLDLETTGLPMQERNRTKIIEISLISVVRRDLERALLGYVPPTGKLVFTFNPTRLIHPAVTRMTSLSNSLLANSPLFKDKAKSIMTFLDELPKPVCLVAHNGNSFDFKILLSECNEAEVQLPQDLLCVDSLVGFRNLLKGTSICYNTLISTTRLNVQDCNDLVTDDEDEWPDLNLSTEEWIEIDELCESFSDTSCEDVKVKKTYKQMSRKESKKRMSNDRNIKECFKLSSLYKRLVNKEENNHHRAEADCLMLLECVIAVNDSFLPWMDKACKKFLDIKPLIPY